MNTALETSPTVTAQAEPIAPGPYVPSGLHGEEDGDAPSGPLLEYRPPPVECLPPPLAEYIAKSAEAIGCDPCLVAMPALAVCAAAIGDSRAIQVKPGWLEFPIIWSLVVAPSGALKTPAMKAAMEALEDAQRGAFESYRAAELAYKRDLAAWKEKGSKGQEPVPPPLTSYYIGDATLEAVCARLRDNPRGLLQKRDELSGWLGSFDKYSDGNEAAQWLEFHSGNSLRVDRKGGDSPTIYIPRALVSVTGTIQEAVLRKILTDEGAQHFDNGLAARFLMAMPPERVREWREEFTPPSLRGKYAELTRDLLALAPQTDPDTGRREPVIVQWQPDAKDRFAAFVNEHGREMRAFKSDRLKSAWSKLEGQAARLALIFHCIRHAYLPRPDSATACISLDTLNDALRWIEWLKSETRRIYYTLSRHGEGRQADRLMAFARRCGGSCTAREAARQGAGGRDADTVEKLMRSLVTAGFGDFITPEQPKGGRPTKVFRLRPVPAA